MNGVFRGGRLGNSANVIKSASRNGNPLGYMSATVGFLCEWCYTEWEV